MNLYRLIVKAAAQSSQERGKEKGKEEREGRKKESQSANLGGNNGT